MNVQAAIDNLRTAARKDPKKAGMLVLLVAVMGGMWGKVLLRHSPAPAAAGAAATDATAANATSAPAFGGAGSAASSDKTSAGRADWKSVSRVAAGRNLFRVDYTRFEKAGRTGSDGSAQQSGDPSGDPSKSSPSPADLRKERQILVANLQAQAAQLKLQTIVMGAQPKALVNGSLVEEGDIVASFRVARISARGIVVEREGIRFDVSMK